jgi:hypothetical protein
MTRKVLPKRSFLDAHYCATCMFLAEHLNTHQQAESGAHGHQTVTNECEPVLLHNRWSNRLPCTQQDPHNRLQPLRNSAAMFQIHTLACAWRTGKTGLLSAKC